MSKSAALRKALPAKKPVKATKAQKTKPAAKMPQLKVVKPAPRAAAKPAAKPVAKAKIQAKKAVKPAVAAKKPVVDARQLLAKQPSAPAAVVPAVKPMQRPPIRPTTGFSRPAIKIPPMVEMGKKLEFKIGSYVVYPTHGVGKIAAEETQDIGGHKIKMFVIVFERDKMTLRVPVARAQSAGLRHVGGNVQMQKMFDTLKGKPKTSRGMWSRRAQEYESKINSGNVLLIAEVVRDLHNNVDQSERSYSERMIYENAFNRLAGELAASTKVEHKNAADKLLVMLRAKRAA